MNDSTAKCVKCDCPSHHTKPADHTHDDLVIRSLTVTDGTASTRVTITPQGIWVGTARRAAAVLYANGQPTLTVYDTEKGGGRGFQLAATIDADGNPCLQFGGADGRLHILSLDDLRELTGAESVEASDVPLDAKSC